VVIVDPVIGWMIRQGHLLEFDGKNWRLKEAAARIVKAATGY
jgi:hypothetical protein